MSRFQIIKHRQFGEVCFTKRKGAKYIKINIKPNFKVSVTLPFYVKYTEAQKFLEEKIDWVKDCLYKQAQAQKENTFDLSKSYRSKYHDYEFLVFELDYLHQRKSAERVKIYYPKTSDFEDYDVQKFIRDTIKSYLVKEAKRYLPNRVAELAIRHDFKFKKVKINSAQTRWGSCSHDNNINLSAFLMQLPDELIDYVILHELTHTVHKNHSKYFWALLGACLESDAKSVDAKMQDYTTQVRPKYLEQTWQ